MICHSVYLLGSLENIVLPQLANGIARGAAETRARDLLTRVGIEARAAALALGRRTRKRLSPPPLDIQLTSISDR